MCQYRTTSRSSIRHFDVQLSRWTIPLSSSLEPSRPMPHPSTSILAFGGQSKSSSAMFPSALHFSASSLVPSSINTFSQNLDRSRLFKNTRLLSELDRIKILFQSSPSPRSFVCDAALREAAVGAYAVCSQAQAADIGACSCPRSPASWMGREGLLQNLLLFSVGTGDVGPITISWIMDSISASSRSPSLALTR